MNQILITKSTVILLFMAFSIGYAQNEQNDPVNFNPYLKKHTIRTDFGLAKAVKGNADILPDLSYSLTYIYNITPSIGIGLICGKDYPEWSDPYYAISFEDKPIKKGFVYICPGLELRLSGSLPAIPHLLIGLGYYELSGNWDDRDLGTLHHRFGSFTGIGNDFVVARNICLRLSGNIHTLFLRSRNHSGIYNSYNVRLGLGFSL
ncbi:MAG: hypothetical protein NTV06_06980 [candidate division Zixibacteria bacterium]|nr:hypothetical protein [candidate division Zixibacteria bacterium]